mmetsp:Transcript_2516/g.4343  ORF Transcript_2516/g.4343 Transcript_2516/m.4343 type:complete len:80 (+) Transcript_2516:657-896(+)
MVVVACECLLEERSIKLERQLIPVRVSIDGVYCTACMASNFSATFNLEVLTSAQSAVTQRIVGQRRLQVVLAEVGPEPR